MLRIEIAERHHAHHLGDGELARRRHDRAEIARRGMIDEIAPAIGAMGADEGDISVDRLFQQIGLAVDHPRFLAFGQRRAHPGADIEPADPGPACTNPLAQGTLRHQFEFEFPPGVDLLEPDRSRRARVRADDLAHRPLAQQRRDPGIADPGIVGDDGEVAGAPAQQCAQQQVGCADLAEAAHQDGGTVLDPVNRGFERGDDLVDHDVRAPFASFRARQGSRVNCDVPCLSFFTRNGEPKPWAGALNMTQDLRFIAARADRRAGSRTQDDRARRH